MPVTDILIEPHGVTRVFFDCRNADSDAAEQQRIGQAIARSTALAQVAENTPSCAAWTPLHMEQSAAGS